MKRPGAALRQCSTKIVAELELLQMHTIALFSLKGGVGTTTLTANFGAALAQTHTPGLLTIDLSPRNQLGMHFGLSGREPGLAHASLRGVGWSRALRQGIDRIGCLPFGALSEEELIAFEQLV